MGVQTKKTFRGRGMDVFWNNTMTCLVEKHYQPLATFPRCFHYCLCSHDLRKGLDRLMTAWKMLNKREAQMRGYLFMLFVTKIIIFSIHCLVICVSLLSESQTKESKSQLENFKPEEV